MPLPAHLAVESGVADDAVDPAVEAPGEVARAGVRVARAPTGEQHLAVVGSAIAVGVLEVHHVGRHRDDEPAVVGQQARGDGESFDEDVTTVGLAVAVGVGELDDPIMPLDGGRGILLCRLDEVVRVVHALGDVNSAIAVEAHRERLACEQRLGREQLDAEALGRDRVLPRLLGREGLLHLHRFAAAGHVLAVGPGLVERNPRRLVLETGEPGGRLRHLRMIDMRARGRWITTGRESDAPLDEIVEARMAPRSLVVAPGRVEDAAAALAPHPRPRLPVIPIDPLLEDRAAAVVVLRVHVGLVPALEAAETLHDRVARRDVHRAELPGAVLLKLCPHEVDPGRRVAKTKTRAVQRHEALAAADEIEDGGLAVRRQAVDVGVNGQHVVGVEHRGGEILEPLRVDELDAARREHGLQLREPLGGRVVPLVTEEQHLDRRFRSRDGRCRQQAGDREQQAFHHEKLHSGNFMIAPPRSADSWARMPVQVQFALCFALG